jgi:hypothetical protein
LASRSLRWQIGESMELSVNAELLRTHGPYREPGQGFTFHPAGLRRGGGKGFR